MPPVNLKISTARKDASIAVGIIEEIVALMRRLTCAPDSKWWWDGGLRDGMHSRLTGETRLWSDLTTICVFLAGLDERPYLGCLVNFALAPATPTEIEVFPTVPATFLLIYLK